MRIFGTGWRPGRVFIIMFRESKLLKGGGPEVDGPDVFLASSRGAKYERGTIGGLRLKIVGPVLRDLRPQSCPQVVDPCSCRATWTAATTTGANNRL